ncbi:MAG: hemerythrin domain-containing protein [Polyangiaceae bacterium]
MDPRRPTWPAVAERRRFLREAARGAMWGGAALVLTACAPPAKTADHPRGEDKKESEEEGAEVTPGEDLMQEHGLLERVLLIYEAAADRVERAEALEPGIVVDAATIIRSFVEDYHEKQEEDFVFPALARSAEHGPLVETLREQHRRGRRATDEILRIARAGGAEQAALAPQLRAFVRMYRPHAAREETVLLPAFRRTLDDSGYRELGEKFEDREHALFGEGGFEDVVKRAGAIEAALGIDDLARFTVA